MRALVLGYSAWDTLIQVDEINKLYDDMFLWAKRMNTTVGSTGAGKAITLDRLGVDVTLITNLADDEAGQKIREFYNKTGIKVISVATDITVQHTNIMHGKGKRISVVTGNPTYVEGMIPEYEKHIQECDVVFLNINDYCRSFIPYIKKYSKKILVDIHDYDPPNPYHQEFIDVADILIGSDIHIKDKKAFLKKNINLGKDIVVLTSGSKGLIALDHKYETYNIEGFNDFEYKDSNGAGDSFCAGFMVKLFESKNYGKALEYGNICGGLACSSNDLFRLDIDKSYVDNIYKKRND
jgi:sugar/nucleoside kinase (ribokinase family)